MEELGLCILVIYQPKTRRTAARRQHVIVDETLSRPHHPDPEGSLLYQRMGERSFYQMPPLGTEVVDSDAHATVYEWIMGLPQEQP